MKTRPGRPRGLTRLARTLGLDRNPLRRATDRAEAWIRVGLLAVFLIAGALALLAVLRVALAFLSRRRLAAWETAWSRVGPHWSKRRP